MEVLQYKIKTPFEKYITRTRKTRQDLVLCLMRDVNMMFHCLPTHDKETMEHKIDWYNNNNDYPLDSSCYTVCESTKKITLNYNQDSEPEYLVALFKMLNVPLRYASDPYTFDIVP